MDWFYPRWPAASLSMGIVLLLLAPALAPTWSLALLMVYLQLPIYLLHQVEEHVDDRFRRFVNQRVFGGAEALTPMAILVINLPGVWGVSLAGLYAAIFGGAGWGLTPIYLVLINGVTHVAATVASRGYNPGLWTSIALFLPVGGFALWAVSAVPGVTALHHIVGFAIALVIHIAIVAYARVRTGRLQAARVSGY